MRMLLRNCLLVFVIIGPTVILPTVSGVEPRDYEEALKEDEPPESVRASESSTEYPNGVNVIPGNADIHYPTYDKIPKSSFSCLGRIPGFYADAELRCQVWHICNEGGVQTSYLCTNGTIYSQEKRVCDWWYNVNCDPEEVSRNYEQNKELYKGPPPKDEPAYEEATSNDLPPPPPPPHKKPVQPHQQQQRPQQTQRPQNYQQPQQRPQPQPSHRPHNYEQPQQQQQTQRQQNFEQSQQRPQNQNYEKPAQSLQQQRAEALKVIENYEQQLRSRDPNYEKSQQTPDLQQREQQRAEALKIIQDYEQSQQRQNQQSHEPPQARRQPQPQQNNNYIAPTQPTPRQNQPPQAQGTPEKKRVIVLRLPGPLAPGATIPPHILMEYAESVLAAERSGKAPPPGLVSNKQVPVNNQRPPPPQQQQQQYRPQQQNQPQSQQHHQRPQQQNQQQQQHQQRSQPTQIPQQQQQNQHQQQNQQRPQPTPTQQRPQQAAQPQPHPTPQQQSGPPPRKSAPFQPVLPYTPRPFSAFLEDAVKFNGQSKSQTPQQRPQTPPPTPQQQRQSTPQHRPPIPVSQQQQPKRYEEPRQAPTTITPQQNYEQRQPQQRRPQQQPSYQEESYQEEQSRPQQAPVAPQKKTPVQHKPSKSAPHLQPTDSKKFRHSTPRKHGETKFAPKSSVSFDDLEDERQVHEESRRPTYFNNFQHVPHLSQDSSTSPPAQTYQTQPPPPKADVHLKSSFELEKVRPQRVKQPQRQHQETTERYLTPEEIHEPAIKRLVVAAGLKIKDPRNKQLTTPVPNTSSGSSEESYNRERNYEPVRVIVARKSTTTLAPEVYQTSPSTPTTVTEQAQNHQRRPSQQNKSTPRGPILPYTPRPFSAFLEDASRHNGFSKTKTTSTPQPQPENTADTNEETTTPRVVMRRVIRKKIRVNPGNNKAHVILQVSPTEQSETHQEPQAFQKIVKSTAVAPLSTVRSTTTSTTTTPYYQPEDYYEPTRATKNFGFDVYGRTEDDDEEEELVRAAQEYYQFSEDYGKRHRG